MQNNPDGTTLLVPHQTTFALVTIQRRRASAAWTTDVSAQMSGEESQRVVYLEPRQISVLAGVGVQCLLG